MKKVNKEIVFDYLINKNERQYNILKTVEELQELALALIQSVNKDNIEDDIQIIEEIGDVKIRMKVLETMFDEQKIKTRINYKLNKFLKYINQNKYKNI